MFKVGREVRVEGKLRDGVFVGEEGLAPHEMPFEVHD